MTVYFIACAGFIKVGFSDDPEKRTKNLFKSTSRYTAPRAVYAARGTQELIATIGGTKNTERAMHNALDDFYAGCEWFVDEPQVREFAATATPGLGEYPKVVRDGGPVEVPKLEQGGRNIELHYELMAKAAAR